MRFVLSRFGCKFYSGYIALFRFFAWPYTKNINNGIEYVADNFLAILFMQQNRAETYLKRI